MMNLPGRYFDVFGVEFLLALQQVLGEKFTDDVKNAWHHFYDILVNSIQEKMAIYNADTGYKITAT